MYGSNTAIAMLKTQCGEIIVRRWGKGEGCDERGKSECNGLDNDLYNFAVFAWFAVIQFIDISKWNTRKTKEELLSPRALLNRLSYKLNYQIK